MSDKEKLIRIGYYASQLGQMFQYANMGDAGYRAAGIIRCITLLTWHAKTENSAVVFEHFVKAGEFAESDQAVRDAGL